MRILLTGATGLIGRRLRSYLEGKGHDVLTLSRSPVPGDKGVVLPDLDPARIRPAVAGVCIDAAVNLAGAGVHPADREITALMKVNSLLPFELVAIARDLGARAFVHAGSSAEYAQSADTSLLDEDAPLEFTRAYGATKAAGSLLALARGAQVALPVAVLRLFHVYGPDEAPHRLLSSLVTRLARSEVVPLSIGTQVRDFVHIDDVCAAILVMLDRLLLDRSCSGCYNVAAGVGTSVADFACSVAAALGAERGLLHFGELPMRPDDFEYVVGSPEKLRRLTRWVPKYTVGAGIDHVVQEMRHGFGH